MHSEQSLRIILIVFLVVFVSHSLSVVVTRWDSLGQMFAVTSLMQEGNLDLDEYSEEIGKLVYNRYAFTYAGGHCYLIYPIGTTLLYAPVVWFFNSFLKIVYGGNLQEFGWYSDAVELLAASFLVALAAVVIYLIAELRLKRRDYSLLFVFIFAFCTSAWSLVSRGLWQHGPSMLMLAVALYFILLAQKRPSLIQFAGIPLIFSFFVRPTNIISFSLLTIFIFLHHRKYFLLYLLWASSVCIPFVVYHLRIYNFFVSPYYYIPVFSSNYGFNARENFFSALCGQLFSPSRGIFIFSPILLFSLAGIFLKIKNKAFEKLDFFILVIMLLHWLAVSFFTEWHSGFSIGNRNLSEMLPYLMYCMLPVFLWIPALTRSKKTIALALFFTAMAVSFAVHHRCATNYGPYYWNIKHVDNLGVAAWDWKDTQFFNRF